MKAANFIALFCSFTLLLFTVLGQKTTSNSKEDLGRKLGIRTQRKLERDVDSVKSLLNNLKDESESQITDDTEKSDDIIILHTNDVHSGVQDSIGYDGLMLFKKQLMRKYKNVILVDAGDHVQGGTMGLITNGEAIIDIMNKLEYEAVTIGNHEFDYGISQLESLEKLLNCSYISSNYCLKTDKKPIYAPYKIIEKGSKKIGFIGVATPQSLSKTFLITLLDSNGELVYDFLTDNHSQELYDRVQQHIDEMKEQGVDYIIIIGHLGIGGDALEENTSAGLLKNLKGVNALIDGHTHLIYSQTTPDKDGKDAILVQTGTKLTNIGVLTIHTDGTLTHENIDEVPYDPYFADETLNVTRSKVVRYVDKEMNQFINDISESFSDKLQEVIGKTDFLLNIYKNATESLESSTQLSRLSENALCNLVTDSMRELGEADVSIMNAGTVRSDINQGDIKYQDVINTMPFSNDVLVQEITGQTIFDALEFGVRVLPGRTSRFPQVSAITYKVDISINSTVEVDENEVFQKLGKENRVYDVKVNGEDLDLEKTYTISSHSFILNGGDGYSMFIGHEILKTSVGVDNEVLLDYIINNLNGTIPDKYRTSEGRLIKTNGKIFGDIKISLLGFNNLTIYSQLITFNAYYASLENVIFEFPKQLMLNTTLSSNSKRRRLEDVNKNAYCFIQNEVNETTAKYLCEISGDTSGINNIKIEKINHTNFAVKLTPLASKYMNNLEKIDNGNELKNLNNNLYVLQNATIKKDGNSAIISGELSGNEFPSFSSNELSLYAIEKPSNNEKELKCTVNNKEGNKYEINCPLESGVTYDLDNSVIVDEDKSLLINFKDGNQSQIPDDTQPKPDPEPKPEPEPEDNNSIGTRYFRNNSKNGLSGGYIALIAIICAIVLALVVGLFIYFNKSRTPIEQTYDISSSRNNIKI